jgi:predicted esterase
MQPTRVFIHGLESTSRGTKGRFFRERYPEMIIEDYSGSFDERMVTLNHLLAGKDDLVLVGSSYGGLMAAVFACLYEARVRKLILLAPALHLDSYQRHLKKKLNMPIAIFHGLQDEVVPLEIVRKIASESFVNCTFDTPQDDHVLHRTFASLDWDALLKI